MLKNASSSVVISGLNRKLSVHKGAGDGLELPDRWESAGKQRDGRATYTKVRQDWQMGVVFTVGTDWSLHDCYLTKRFPGQWQQGLRPV
jgi:hypothetical protein